LNEKTKAHQVIVHEREKHLKNVIARNKLSQRILQQHAMRLKKLKSVLIDVGTERNTMNREKTVLRNKKKKNLTLIL